MAANPEPLFYIERVPGQRSGPYDLVQMSRMLRTHVITPDTPTCLEGTDHWQPFSWQPQFSIAKEMSPDAVSTRVLEKEAEELAKREPIPLPPTATMIQIAAGCIGFVMLGIVAFALSWTSSTVGYGLIVLGIVLALLGTCFGLVRFVDESIITQLKVLFIPMYEIYYLIINFWDYLPFFCLRWTGCLLIIASLLGITVGRSDDREAAKPAVQQIPR